MDLEKVQCLVEWPKPTTLKGLHGFLGLAGYYRHFVPKFGLIAKPLTDMLKVGNFNWTPISEEAFAHLKQVMTSAPVLSLPKFLQAVHHRN